MDEYHKLHWPMIVNLRQNYFLRLISGFQDRADINSGAEPRLVRQAHGAAQDRRSDIRAGDSFVQSSLV